MLEYADLAEICRNADTEAEEHGDMEAFFVKRGVGMAGLSEVAIQRALRVCLRIIGSDDPGPVHVTQTVRLPPHVRALLPAIAATFVDGFNAGMTAQQKISAPPPPRPETARDRFYAHDQICGHNVTCRFGKGDWFHLGAGGGICTKPPTPPEDEKPRCEHCGVALDGSEGLHRVQCPEVLRAAEEDRNDERSD